MYLAKISEKSKKNENTKMIFLAERILIVKKKNDAHNNKKGKTVKKIMVDHKV